MKNEKGDEKEEGEAILSSFLFLFRHFAEDEEGNPSECKVKLQWIDAIIEKRPIETGMISRRSVSIADFARL